MAPKTDKRKRKVQQWDLPDAAFDAVAEYVGEVAVSSWEDLRFWFRGSPLPVMLYCELHKVVYHVKRSSTKPLTAEDLCTKLCSLLRKAHRVKSLRLSLRITDGIYESCVDDVQYLLYQGFSKVVGTPKMKSLHLDLACELRHVFLFSPLFGLCTSLSFKREEEEEEEFRINWSALFCILSNATRLFNLSVAYTPYDYDGRPCKGLCHLSKIKHLQVLRLEGQIAERCMESLACCLSNSPNIKHLAMAPISDYQQGQSNGLKVIELLAEHLETNTSLEFLQVSYKSTQAANIEASLSILFKSLSTKSALQELCISTDRLYELKNSAMLVSLIRSNKTLRTLCLGALSLSVDQALAVALALPGNETLRAVQFESPMSRWTSVETSGERHRGYNRRNEDTEKKVRNSKDLIRSAIKEYSIKTKVVVRSKSAFQSVSKLSLPYFKKKELA